MIAFTLSTFVARATSGRAGAREANDGGLVCQHGVDGRPHCRRVRHDGRQCHSLSSSSPRIQ